MSTTKHAISRNTGLPVLVETQSAPDSLGRCSFTLMWMQDGRERGQCFFAKLEDYVIMTAADFRAEMGRRLGCVALVRARSTGSLVGLYRTAETDLDEEIGSWAVVCEAHHTILGVESKARARASMADPAAFCDDCRDANVPDRFLGDRSRLMLGRNTP